MSQTLKIKELHEERNTLIADARCILERANREKRDMTDEEKDKFELLHRESDRLKSLEMHTKRQLDLEHEEREAAAERYETERRQNKNALEPELRREIENRAFEKWLRNGGASLTVDERQALRYDPERRAQGVASDGVGGFLVPEDYQREIEVAMKDYVGVLNTRARVIRTATGADLPWPSYDDTSEVGEIIGEGTQVDSTNHDITFTSTTLQAYMYSSNAILVSYQLLQDSAFNLDSELRRALGTRLGRILNQHTTTGTGSAQPNGIVTAAADALGATTSPSASAAAFGLTFTFLTQVFHAVDPAYRQNAEWMFHDDVLQGLRLLEDSAGNPIWQPSARPGAPDTILGKPFTVNNDMAAPANLSKSLIFGDFSKYVVRLVVPSTVMRLNERYADYLQVGFIGYMRMDADIVEPNASPIVYLDWIT